MSRLMRLLVLATVVLPVAVVAVSPDQEPYFMGWYLAPDSSKSSLFVVLHSSPSQHDASCRIATSCYGITIIMYEDGSSAEYSNGAYCMTVSILQAYPKGDSSALQLWCNSI